MTLTDTFHIGLATGPANPAGAAITTLVSLPASFVGEVTPSGNISTGWASVDIPSYMLPAGSYWIVVSATDLDSPEGLAMPSGAPNPLTQYAYMTADSNGWRSLSTAPNGAPYSLGFDVEGAPVSPVPLPGTFGMLLSVPAAFSVLRRRRALL